MGIVKKIFIGGAGLLALAVAAGLVLVWWIGAWGILFPSHAHETTPPAIAADFGADAVILGGSRSGPRVALLAGIRPAFYAGLRRRWHRGRHVR